MKEKLRKNIETFLFDYAVPTRMQEVLPRTAVFYIFFGSISTSIDIGIFYIAGEWFGLDYILAATAAFLCSSFLSFLSNKYLNFQNKSEKVVQQYGVFITIGISSLLWTYLFLYVFIDILGLHRMAAKVVTALIVAFYSYLVHTKLTFGMRRFSE